MYIYEEYILQTALKKTKDLSEEQQQISGLNVFDGFMTALSHINRRLGGLRSQEILQLIEIAHGRMPKKTKPIERENFFKTIEVAADDWEALQRSFRPKRHAEPHDMVGRTISPRLARILIQHALKLWLAREVPA